MIYFYKILRTTAWILLLVTLFTLLSGFLMVKIFLFPWMSYELLRYLHVTVAPMIFIPVFFLHSLSGIMILFTRYKFLNKKLLKIGVSVFWTLIFFLFIFLYFAKDPSIQNINNNAPPSVSPTPTPSVVNNP